MKRIYQVNSKGPRKAEVLIYEDIGEGWFGGLSAKRFAADISAMGKLDELNVRINSAGGNVFDGVAIYNTLVKNDAKVIVDIDGMAASIASIIAMAGDEVRIADNAFVMIHDPWTYTAGTADELRDMAVTMDKIRETLLNTYAKRAKSSPEELSEMMHAETWLNAKEALESGLVDSITGAVPVEAFSEMPLLGKFKNTPERLRAENWKPASIDVALASMNNRTMQAVRRLYNMNSGR